MTKHEYSRTTWAGEKAARGDWPGESGRSPRAIPMVDEQLDSRDLFAVGRLVTIAHGGQTYQLRLTAQNKLILTK